MQATPIKVDITTGMKTVTLLVADFTPFLVLGKPVELTVSPFAETAPDPANIVQMAPQAAPAAPQSNDELKGTEPYQEQPMATSGPMGAMNHDNPNACPICYGYGLVKEFRDANDITGTPATCKTCGGTGINRENQTAAPVTSAVKPCPACEGSGIAYGNEVGNICEECKGSGVEM